MNHDPEAIYDDDPDKPPAPRTLREKVAARLGIDPREQLASPAPPSDDTPPAHAVPAAEVETDTSRAKSDSPARSHPMMRFSLRGKADELEARAANTKPLLGSFIMDGQATMIYAAPNTGKTLIVFHLILEAIEQGRVNPNNVFFFNGDDGSQGLATKARLLQDVGAHMLAPGHITFKISDLTEAMNQAIKEDSARETVIIIDTLKKATDLMDKKRTSEFAQVCRQYVMAGGAILGLGHTRKNPKADGTPQYQGTTDILEDFDAVYIAQLLEAKTDASLRVVDFRMEKKRADSPDHVFYAYAADPGLSYEEKLVSVRTVDPSDLDDYVSVEKFSHPEVMTAISTLIQDGEGEGQMALMRKAAKAAGVSERVALRVLQEFTGTTSRQHLWNFHTGHRGVRLYELLEQG